MNKIEFENGSQIEGIKTNYSIRGIRSIINKIANGNVGIETIEKELNNYGIKIRDEQGNYKNTYDILQELKNAI